MVTNNAIFVYKLRKATPFSLLSRYSLTRLSDAVAFLYKKPLSRRILILKARRTNVVARCTNVVARTKKPQGNPPNNGRCRFRSGRVSRSLMSFQTIGTSAAFKSGAEFLPLSLFLFLHGEFRVSSWAPLDLRFRGYFGARNYRMPFAPIWPTHSVISRALRRAR